MAADCDDGYAFSAPVGSFKPNPWGLYDMLGNVLEFAEDCYADDPAKTKKDDESSKPAEECRRRVIRGGSWNNDIRQARAAFRYQIVVTERSATLGFRLARTGSP